MARESVQSGEHLRLLSRAELVERWVVIYRHPPPKGVKRGLLERAIDWHAKAQEEGGLGPSLVWQLSAGPARQTVAASPRPTAIPGTRLVREWGGRTHAVDVTADGCVWNGRTYRSLSAVARAITGSRWSGPRFFGVAGDDAR